MYLPTTTTLSGAPTPAFTTTAEGKEKWSSLIGVATAITGNLLISFALNIQRYAHMRLGAEQGEKEEKGEGTGKKRKGENGRSAGKSANGYGTQGDVEEAVAEERAEANLGGERRPLLEGQEAEAEAEGDGEGEGDDGKDESAYLKDPIWWIGLIMMIVGEAGNFLAYGFAPASIVSPLGVVALISNCMIAPWFLHEPFRWRDAFGVLLAMLGCVVVVFSGSSSSPKLTPELIWYLITRWEFLTYMAITWSLIAVFVVLSEKPIGDRVILIDISLVGLIGSYTVLSTTGVASLLSNTIWRVVTFPIFYILVVILVVTAVFQIKYLNRALMRFNSTMVVPTQFVLFTILVIIGSAILYRDFERISLVDGLKFVGGCALTFLGVWGITGGRGEENEDSDGEDEDGEAEDQTTARGDTDSIDMVDEESPESNPAPSTNTTKPPAPTPTDLGPANAAAIHTHTTPTTTPRRPLHATTSTPLVPTLAGDGPTTPTRPQTPLKRTATALPHPSPSHHPATGTPHRPSPLQRTATARRALTRSSASSLLMQTAPLTRTLSSGLSGVVAESRRVGGKRSRTSLRRAGTNRGAVAVSGDAEGERVGRNGSVGGESTGGRV